MDDLVCQRSQEQDDTHLIYFDSHYSVINDPGRLKWWKGKTVLQ